MATKKAMQKNSKIEAVEPITVEAEEIHENTSVISMEVTKIVNKEILRLDPFKKRLAEIKEKYSGLTAESVDDVDGRQSIKEAVADMRGIRNRSKDEADAAKKPLQDGIKSINEALAFITDGVWEIEEPLSNRQKELNQEDKRLAAERKRLKDEQYTRRQQELFAFGAKYDADGNFVLGDVSFDSATIRETDESLWLSDIKPEYEAIFNAAQAEKAAAQKLIDDAAAELQRQKDALAEQQRLHNEQVAALEKAKKEMADAAEKAEQDKRKAIISARSNQLQALGMTYSYGKSGYEFGDIFIEFSNHAKEIPTDEEFSATVNDLTTQIAAAKVVIAENKKKDEEAEILRKEQAATRNHRYKILMDINATDISLPSLGTMPTAEWDKLYSEKKAAFDKAEKEAADKKREEELQASTDKIKWQAVIQAINEVPLPDMKHSAYKSKMNSLKSYLNKIKDL